MLIHERIGGFYAYRKIDERIYRVSFSSYYDKYRLPFTEEDKKRIEFICKELASLINQYGIWWR